MRWHDLHLNDMDDIEKQVDEVVRTYEALNKQLEQKKGNVVQLQKAVEMLQKSILQQIARLEQFYHQNDLDPRASRVEACRLKLKRLLGKSVSSSSPAAPVAPQPSVEIPSVSLKSSRIAPERIAFPSPITSPFRPDGSDTITLKIRMTHEEFDELRMRRKAVNKMLQRGEGKQSWETAFSRPRVNTIKEGVGTYHEIPYTSTQPSPRPTSTGSRFITTRKPPSVAIPTPINAGLPYDSANVEVVSRTLRFGTLDDERTGGTRAVSPRSRFNPVVGRTKATNPLFKAQSFGAKHV